jgi:hypothetical protein
MTMRAVSIHGFGTFAGAECNKYLSRLGIEYLTLAEVLDHIVPIVGVHSDPHKVVRHWVAR